MYVLTLLEVNFDRDRGRLRPQLRNDSIVLELRLDRERARGSFCLARGKFRPCSRFFSTSSRYGSTKPQERSNRNRRRLRL